MASTAEATRSPSSNNQEQQQPPPVHQQPIAPYPPQFNPAHYPSLPPGTYPFYAYPVQPDGNHDPNAPPTTGPYLIPIPPGMVYAYAPIPGQGYPPFLPGVQPPPAPRAKRKQVKMACTNCASACKRCDDNRPCERCCKYGIADSCIDGVRKERKKGLKRGPYKRKSKNTPGEASFSGMTPPAQENQAEQQVQPISYPLPPPEGYYPYYYPHPGFVPAPPPNSDGQQTNGESASAPPSNAPHPSLPHPPPFFPLHPAVYPSYPPYPHGGAVAYAPPGMPGFVPASASPNGEQGDDANGKGKKRARPREENGAQQGKKTRAGNENGTAEVNGANGHHSD
ncbi:hypothetical protein C8Q75DRAFT_728137 [Abortiporus biennis]|nr:hypothetical protein C8Q75DRAFT_728137 [Abortiporus biennis]